MSKPISKQLINHGAMNAIDPALILFINDAPSVCEVRELLETALRSAPGLAIVHADAQDGALDEARSRNFSAILINMRCGADAIAMARRLRSCERSRGTPILFFVMPGDGFSFEDAYGLGAVDHVMTSVLPSILRAKLDFLASIGRNDRQLQAAEREAGEAPSGEPNPERKPTEEQLRLREDRYKRLFDSMDEGYCLIDVLFDASGQAADFRFLEVNPAFDKHTGLHDVTGRTARELIPNLDQDWFDTFGRVARTGEALRFVGEASAMHRWYEVYATRLGEGANARLALLFTDITQRKQSEEREHTAAAEALAAAEANAKFRTFFEQGSYFAGVMTLDGTIVEANRLCLDACGFAREEVIGKKFWDCGWWNPSPELMEMVRQGTAQAAAGNLFRTESKYYVADGSERVVDLVLAPVTDESGKVLFIAPSGVDITERKRVEERLRVLDRMSEATRTASDPKAILMHTTRLLGEYLGVSHCAYADVDTDSERFTIRHDWTAPGARSTAGVHSLDGFGAGVAACIRTGRTLVIRDVDRELAATDGAQAFRALAIKAIICCPLVKEGNLVAMMAVHQDVPRDWTTDDVAFVQEVVERSWAHIERVRATEVLREADRRKDEFLATLAHETA